MAQQILRDNMHRIIGYIDTDGNGKQTGRDFMHRIVGYYYPSDNTTRDSLNRIVGYGNLLASLIR